MLRFHDRLRLCIWGVLAALVAQGVVVWLALRSVRREVRNEMTDAESRLTASYATAASNTVQRVLDVVTVSAHDAEEAERTDADSAPRVRVLGVGRNGYYDYLDVAVVDADGMETVRRVYRRSARPDSRSPRDRRPPGY